MVLTGKVRGQTPDMTALREVPSKSDMKDKNPGSKICPRFKQTRSSKPRTPREQADRGLTGAAQRK